MGNRSAGPRSTSANFNSTRILGEVPKSSSTSDIPATSSETNLLPFCISTLAEFELLETYMVFPTSANTCCQGSVIETRAGNRSAFHVQGCERKTGKTSSAGPNWSAGLREHNPSKYHSMDRNRPALTEPQRIQGLPDPGLPIRFLSMSLKPVF